MGFDPQFTVRIDARNGVANVALRGELDMATVPHLEDHLVHLERSDVEAIMLDIRELSFLDCSALRAFVTARNHAEENGHLLVFAGVGARARRLFEITGTEFLLNDGEAAGVIARFLGDGAGRTNDLSDVITDA